MSEVTTTQPFGFLPMRRVITILFIIGSIAGGIHFASAEPAAVSTVAGSATPTPPPTSQSTLGGPVCDGTILNTDCAMVEGNDPGPVIALGYGSMAQAKFHCVGGVVVTLYRQHKIVGYGCNGGG